MADLDLVEIDQAPVTDSDAMGEIDANNYYSMKVKSDPFESAKSQLVGSETGAPV